MESCAAGLSVMELEMEREDIIFVTAAAVEEEAQLKAFNASNGTFESSYLLESFSLFTCRCVESSPSRQLTHSQKTCFA